MSDNKSDEEQQQQMKKIYVDRSVIEFLERNHIGSSGTTLLIDTDNNQSRSWRIIQQTIWPLFKDNICGFYLWPTQWRRLRQISPTILYDCANLRSIDSEYFPKFPAEDNAGASSALAKWLLTPRGDGLPKMVDSDEQLDGGAIDIATN
uniref:CRAL-TRIO domain-containing protein n=1 Tax=Globodera pallida TaxID=36090 RepID=A0A183BZ87_GLOPA